MDLIDKKILCELDLNCRTPRSKIAKKLRISRNVVDYRIKNLEKEGIITKYICSVNLGKLGFKTYKIHFKIHNGKKSEKEFVNFLIKNKQTVHFLKVEGSFDYSLAFAVKNVMELDEFLTTLKSRFNDLIKDYYVNIVVYSRVFKLNKLLLNQKSVLKFDKYSGEGDLVKIDDKDIKILRELSQNADLSIIDLSRKTKLSLDIIKYRLKLLSKNLISSYRMIPDVNKVGYYHYVIVLRVKSATKRDEDRLVSWCSLKRNVLFCSKRIGYFDFAINVAISDIDNLNDFLTGLKTEFSNIIDSYEIIINNKLLKLNYVPY